MAQPDELASHIAREALFVSRAPIDVQRFSFQAQHQLDATGPIFVVWAIDHETAMKAAMLYFFGRPA